MTASTRWSLIVSARAGDAAARSSFAARYRPIVQRYLEGRGLGADAEDVAQDVFVRLFKQGGLDGLAPGQGSFRAYLFVVTRHALLDHVRRSQAQKRGGQAQPIPLDDREPSVEEREAFDREWLLNLLERALARLEQEHPNYYAAVKGYLLDGRSQADLAEAGERSLQDVRNHVHRGRKKLVSYIRKRSPATSTSLTPTRPKSTRSLACCARKSSARMASEESSPPGEMPPRALRSGVQKEDS